MDAVDRLTPDRGDVAALLAGVAAVAGSFAVVGRTPAFVVSPVERRLSRAMPGEVIAFAITVLGDLGQELNLAAATLLAVAAVAAIARAAVALGRAANNRAVAPVVTAAVTWAVAAFLVDDLVLAATAGAPAGAVVALGALAPSVPGLEEPLSRPRRRVLGAVGGTLGIGLAGYLAGRGRGPGGAGSDLPTVEGETVDRGAIYDALTAVEERELDYAALDPLLSEDVYQVSINAVDPDVDREEWSLSVTGAVEEPFSIDYDDLTAMPTESRFVTLRCVGEGLNGQKMDTALWTGVPVRELIERAGPESGCGCVMLHGADGYYVQFPLAALEPGLLAFGMNGHVVPRGNGYPVRTLVPGHWGEVNAKWITEIEFLDEAVDGYWEEKGWHGTGPVVPVAKLHTATELEDGRRLLGGHAYAGTRGVGAVEVSTDGGETWSDAELSDSLRFPDREDLGATGDAPHDAWRQWAYTYDPPGESHEVVVRMVDGEGDVQPKEERDSYPKGPSGWVSREFDG